MKKTLIITLEFPPAIGGIATYVNDLAGSLDQNRIVVLAPAESKAETFDKTLGYKVIRRKLFFPKFIWPRWLRLYFVAAKICKKGGIELIMIHHVLPVGYVAQLLKKRLHIPFVLFSHGTDVLAASATTWKTKRLKQVVAVAEELVFNSESLRSRFLRILPDTKAKTIVVYPCPEENFFVPPASDILTTLRRKYALEGKQVLLSIARFDEGKGFPHIIRILPGVIAKNPNIVWLIIGTGPKEKQILDSIQKNSLQNIVRFVGNVPHDELKVFYYLADLFILLTHPDEGREEGLGLVFLEAAACGIPVIAGRSGGVEEGVIHAQTGLVFDVRREADKIAESIVDIFQNRAYLKQLGKQAQERVKADFNWQHQIQKLKPWM